MDQIIKPLVKRQPISHSPEYKAWTKAKERCYNPKTKNFSDYGGRGISMCKEWLNDPHQFIKDMGEKPEPKNNYSLEREDNSLNYSKDNCKWADRKEQANNRRSNKLITYNGYTFNISQWAELLEIKPHTLAKRFKNGWSVEKAFTTPIREAREHK